VRGGLVVVPVPVAVVVLCVGQSKPATELLLLCFVCPNATDMAHRENDAEGAEKHYRHGLRIDPFNCAFGAALAQC